MKVKVTATVTLETDLEPEYYDPPKAEDEMIPWELEQFKNFVGDNDAEASEADSTLIDVLLADGAISDFKIEKIAEDAPVQTEAA